MFRWFAGRWASTGGSGGVARVGYSFFIKRGNANGSALLRTITITFKFGTRKNSEGFGFSAGRARSRLFSRLALNGATFTGSKFFLQTRDLCGITAGVRRVGMSKCNGISLRRRSRKRDFLSLVRGHFEKGKLCVLSRPRTTLSPVQLLALVTRVGGLAGSSSRFVITARSPVLVTFPGTRVLRFSRGNVRTISCGRARRFGVAGSFLGGPREVLRCLFSG